MSNITYKINVMRAFEKGKTVEVCERAMPERWFISPNPKWDWCTCNYRIYTSKPSINWDHVSKEYNYLAQDENGSLWLYKEKPRANVYSDGCWASSHLFNSADTIASATPGDCDWQDSLVTRP